MNLFILHFVLISALFIHDASSKRLVSTTERQHRLLSKGKGGKGKGSKKYCDELSDIPSGAPVTQNPVTQNKGKGGKGGKGSKGGKKKGKGGKKKGKGGKGKCIERNPSPAPSVSFFPSGAPTVTNAPSPSVPVTRAPILNINGQTSTRNFGGAEISSRVNGGSSFKETKWKTQYAFVGISVLLLWVVVY